MEMSKIRTFTFRFTSEQIKYVLESLECVALDLKPN